MKNNWLSYLSTFCLLALTSCQSQQKPGMTITHDQPSGYTIITDTVRFNAQTYLPRNRKMNLEKVERYHNRYICLYRYYDYTSIITELSLDKGNVILSLSKDGQDITQIPTPTGFTTWNRGPLTIQVVNDTLYYMNRGFKSSSYWDETLQEWRETDNTPSFHYEEEEEEEDDEFVANALYRGEWGDYVQFHEKSTGTNYLFLSPMIKCIKYDSAFYIIEPYHIRKVSNPRSGWKKEDNISYTEWGRYAPQVGVVINTRYRDRYDYDCSDDHRQDTLFCSGFIRNGKLHLIVKIMDEVYIAKYKKSKYSTFEKVLSLGNIPVDYDLQSYQNKLLADFEQSWQMDGILDIAKDTVRVTYLRKEYDSLTYLGHQVVEQVLDFVQNNLKVATMDSVRAFEERIGGYSDGIVVETDSRGNTNSEFADKVLGSKWFSSILPNQETGYERVKYFHILNENYSFGVGYCYHQQTQVLTSIMAEFCETTYLNGNKSKRRLQFKDLESIITRCLSVSEDSIGKWNKDGKTYKLIDNYRTRLYIW